MTGELALQITLAAPPTGVSFGLQRGASEVVDIVKSDGGDHTFTLSVRVKEGRDGTPDGRFVYISSGVRAGDFGSCWDRRAKIPLNQIPRDLVEQAQASGAALAVTIPGTSKDGGPVCAGIKLVAKDWRAVS